MRNWNGVHDESVGIGDGLTMLRNVSLITGGQIARRPQLGTRLTLSAALIAGLHPRGGGDFLIAANGSGKLISTDMSAGTSVDVATGINVDLKGCFVEHQQGIYYSNDFDVVKRVNNGTATAVDAGINAPTVSPTATAGSAAVYSVSVVLSAASVATNGTTFPASLAGLPIIIQSSAYSVLSVSASGGSLTLTTNYAGATNSAAQLFVANSAGSMTTGVHRIRYRYKDSRTGFISNPSSEVSLTATAYVAQVAVTASSDTKVDTIVLEMTAAGGSAFYIANNNANTTGTVYYGSSDATLTAGIATDSYWGDFGHEKPPIAELLAEHRGRLFAFKTSIRTNTAVSAVLSAASITGTGFSPNWAGRLISFVGSSSVSYVVSSVSASGTSLTLSTNYAGATSTAASISIFSGTPDMLYWSRAGYPESWKPASWARRVLNNGDKPSALFSAYDTLWVAGQRSLKAFDYTSDPASARISTIPTTMGIYNQRCVVNAEGRVICFGASGVFELRGRVPTRLSNAIDQTLETLIDRSKSEAFHGCYDYYEDMVIFWFCRTGDTVAKDAIAYHLPSGEWHFRTWRQGLKCSAAIGTDALTPRPYVGCENGYVWRFTNSLVADGLPTSLTTGVVTVTGSPTTTSIPVVESLPTGTTDVAGMMLYNPSTGTAKAITSNTANTITCAAFSAAPAAGTNLYLGSIDVFAQTDWWCGPSPQAQKRPSYLMIEHVSDVTAPEILVSIKKGLSSTKETWTKGAGDSMLAGITYTNNANFATVDLSQRSGVLYLNLFNLFSSYWRWEITQEKPAGTLALMDAKFLIRNRSEVDSKVQPT